MWLDLEQDLAELFQVQVDRYAFARGELRKTRVVATALLPEHPCANCGAAVELQCSTHRFCSPRCKQQAYRKEHPEKRAIERERYREQTRRRERARYAAKKKAQVRQKSS